MAEFPAFPLWTDAYLADCGHLSDAEHGRYLMLLMALWRAPNRRLPNDDEWLARRFRRSAAGVRSELRPIVSEFCQCDGNWITQKRLDKEWAYVTKQKRQRTVAAKSRWRNKKNDAGAYAGNVAAAYADEMRETEPPHRSRNAPTPTPTPPVIVVDASVAPPPSDELEAKPEPTTQPEKPNRGTRLADGWEPGGELLTWAAAEHPGVDPDLETAKFRDYWRAKAGKDATKADWPATWRNWIRNSKPTPGYAGALAIPGFLDRSKGPPGHANGSKPATPIALTVEDRLDAWHHFGALPATWPKPLGGEPGTSYCKVTAEQIAASKARVEANGGCAPIYAGTEFDKRDKRQEGLKP